MSEAIHLEDVRTDKARNVAGRVLRLTVSLVLIGLIFYKMDLARFVGLMRQANLIGLAVALLLVIVAVVLSAFKWQRLLLVQGVEVSLPRLTAIYFVGLFFNNFLPTSIGGDVVRIYDLAKITDRPAESAASVISERVLASVALGLVAVAGLLFSQGRAAQFTQLIGAFCALLLLLLLALLTGKRWGPWVARRLPDPQGLKSKARGFLGGISACVSDRWVLAWVILLSVGFQALVVLINYAIFQALGSQVSLAYCLLFIPIIMAISMLPISINGLGVREGAYAYFFGQIGLSTAESVAASLLFFILVALASLIGGAIFALRD